MAKCLCTINQRLLRRIPLTELVDGKYNVQQSNSGEPTALRRFADWFNIECNWTATSVALSGSVLECSYLIQTFIQIIDKCLGFHNFSSAMAIYSALNMGAIQRLSTAWSSVSPKYAKMMTEFDRIFSFKMNFATYRELLRNTEPPCVPIFTVITRDLTHIEEGAPKEIEDEGVSKINFERLSILATHLIFIRNCQLNAYDNDEKSAYMLEKQIRDIKQYEKQELYSLCEEKETSHAAEHSGKRKKKSSLKDFRDNFTDWKVASTPGPSQTMTTNSDPTSALKKSKKRRSRLGDAFNSISTSASPTNNRDRGRNRPTSMIVRQKQRSPGSVEDIFIPRSTSSEDLKDGQ